MYLARWIVVINNAGYGNLSSVDHPRVVENYRSAHEIALRVGKDAATTEDLRTAMIHYRSLFEELVQVPTVAERKDVA